MPTHEELTQERTHLANARAELARMRDRTLALDVRERFGARPAVVALIGGTDAKPSLLVATNAAARERGCRAGALVAAGSEKLGGRGGGRDDLAQGGGTDGGAAGAALQAVEYAVGHAILN